MGHIYYRLVGHCCEGAGTIQVVEPQPCPGCTAFALDHFFDLPAAWSVSLVRPGTVCPWCQARGGMVQAAREGTFGNSPSYEPGGLCLPAKGDPPCTSSKSSFPVCFS